MDPQSVDPFVYVRLTGRSDFLKPKYCDPGDDDDVKVLHTFRNGVLSVDDNGSKGIQPTVPGLVEAAMFVGETDATVYHDARGYAEVPVTIQVSRPAVAVVINNILL